MGLGLGCESGLSFSVHFSLLQRKFFCSGPLLCSELRISCLFCHLRLLSGLRGLSLFCCEL